MTAAQTTTRYTPEDLLAMPKEAGRFELVDGRLLEKAVSKFSDYVAGQILFLLQTWCWQTRLGIAVPEAWIQCFPRQEEMVRIPDVLYISHERRADDSPQIHGMFRVAPDLAIEVLSPSNVMIDMDVKREDYFAAGVRQVWIVNPDVRTVTMYHQDGRVTLLHEHDDLIGDDDLLPGFRCKVADFFALPVPKQD